MKWLTDAWDFLWTEFLRLANTYVVNPLLRIDFRGMMDIIFLALLLFAVYRFTKNRRAGRLFLGLYVVAVVCIVITLFELPTLSFLVRLFASSAFFSMVVIFQPEFRDALERIGNGTFINHGSDSLPRRKLAAAATMTEEITDAVFQMASSKTGALIVLEGLTKLGDYISTGKIVDARVTSHLLQNIFYDKAPLHDGAVIIRNMKIHAASCVLPSTNRDIDFGSMGTRHRAAVGVTENSDAMVIVVSEQTGIVSVAQYGRLFREVNPDMLKDMLMTYVAGRAYFKYRRLNLQKTYRDVLSHVSASDPQILYPNREQTESIPDKSEEVSNPAVPDSEKGE